MDNSEIVLLLQNTIPSAISAIGSIAGVLFTAIYLRNNTSVKEFEMIKAGMFQKVTEELLKSGKMTYTEFYKANNFLKVAQMADKYIEDKKIDNSKPFDFDWFLRFYENAGNISDEYIQNIWAKILAGEIINTGTYSIHLIEILKNFSKKDAELFERICSYSLTITNRNLIPNYSSYMDGLGIKYDEILRLNELQLVNSNGMLTLSLRIPPNYSILCRSDNLLIAVKSLSDNVETINIQHFPFTTIGSELRNIIPIKNQDKCLKLLTNELSKSKNVTFVLRETK